MSKRSDTKIQVVLTEIKAMLASGKTQRDVAEHFNLCDKYIVKELLKRERRKAKKIELGITAERKGIPQKNAPPMDLSIEQDYEIQRLQMENALLRDFLRVTGRK